MNRQYVIDNDLVAGYLRDELSPEERAKFEVFYIDDQDTLDEIEVLSSVTKHLATADKVEASTGGSVVRPLSRRGRPMQAETQVPVSWLWPLATAAALVVGVGVGIATRPSNGPDSVPSLASAALVHVELVRGSDQPVFLIPADRESVLLQVAVGTQESAYRLTLVDGRGQVLSSAALKPDPYGDVAVAVQPRTLTMDYYELQAVGLDTGKRVLSAAIELSRDMGSFPAD